MPNRVIAGNLSNPKGLIGVYDKLLPNGKRIRDTKNALEDLNFPETYASNFLDASADGFKMLRTNPFYWSEIDQFWIEFNLPWLNGLKNNGADVVVLSDKSNDLLIYILNADGTFQEMENGARILTCFGREIEFMDNLVSLGIYQWDEINGLYKYIWN